METKANYVLIGAFTLAVIAGGFLFVLWFSGASKTAEHKTYKIVFTGSVSGLSRGSTVLFNGLNVGAVSSIDFLEKDPSKVAALIEVAGRTPVKTDTKARLESQGLTGVAAIALTGGAEEAPALEPGKDGAPPIINADRSDFQNLLENVQRLSAKADGVLEKADKLLADNSPAITDTLKNVDTFSKALADNSSGVNAALAGVADLGQKIGPLAIKLQGLSDDVDKLVKAVDTDKVRNVVGNVETFTSTLANNQDHLNSLMSDSASLAKKLNATADQLDGALGDIRNLAKSIDTAKVANIVDHVESLVASVDASQVHDIVANVDAFSQTIKRNQDNIDGLLSNAAIVAKNLTGTSEKLNTALTDFSNLAKAVDSQKIGAIVDNVGKFTQTLDDNRGNVDRTLKDASEIAAKLDNSADRLDGLMASIQNFIGSPETKGALAEVGDAARSVRQFADDLNQRTKELAVGLTHFTGSGLREYESLAVDARRTIGDLDRVIRSFERNPNQLIFGSKPALPEYHGGQ
ncbi:MCE family protein [Methylocapsa sp. S129]|uniref:MlaD family protein n=1 Tax=Methylocapsa sp. S129 TaxID=1641869 RepID=UPI00131C0D23|nr:MCE family protein [Methylocapsa sp. S129]